MGVPSLTWKQMRGLLREDALHLARRIEAQGGTKPHVPWLYPPYLCVTLFRLSQLLASRGHRLAARLAWQANVLLTGADLDPDAAIGGGLVVLSPMAVSVSGRAGRNLVLGPLTGVGTDLSARDIGAGPGRPVLGDDVELSALCGVLGPVRVGNRVRIGPCCAVSRDVPDDGAVEPHPPRLLPSVLP